MLADAAYTNSTNVLTPYRGVRYHLKEWQRGGRAPLNYRELYNLRHAQKRNVVESTLGVTKKKFPILQHMLPYSLVEQRDIVICCLLLHNFIRKTNLYDDDFTYT